MSNHRTPKTRRKQQKFGNRIITGVKGICLGCFEYKRLAPDRTAGEGKCWECNHPEATR